MTDTGFASPLSRLTYRAGARDIADRETERQRDRETEAERQRDRGRESPYGVKSVARAVEEIRSRVSDDRPQLPELPRLYELRGSVVPSPANIYGIFICRIRM